MTGYLFRSLLDIVAEASCMRLLHTSVFTATGAFCCLTVFFCSEKITIVTIQITAAIAMLDSMHRFFLLIVTLHSVHERITVSKLFVS